MAPAVVAVDLERVQAVDKELLQVGVIRVLARLEQVDVVMVVLELLREDLEVGGVVQVLLLKHDLEQVALVDGLAHGELPWHAPLQEEEKRVEKGLKVVLAGDGAVLMVGDRRELDVINEIRP